MPYYGFCISLFRLFFKLIWKKSGFVQFVERRLHQASISINTLYANFYDEIIIYLKYIFGKKQAGFLSINPIISTFHKIVSGLAAKRKKKFYSIGYRCYNNLHLMFEK
jgi:hypothetical protein